MKKIARFKRERLSTFIFSLCLILCFAVSSCNKEVPDLLKKDYPSNTNNSGKTRVLYLIIDGATGSAMQVIAPPNINSLIPNSLYSYSGLADLESNPMTNAQGWANLMTGVDVAKHLVSTEDFTNTSLEQYPSIFKLIAESKPDLKMSAFGASAAFTQHLTQEAQTSKTFENDDEGVKSAVVAELDADNNPDFVVAQFHSVELVGSTTDYKDDNPVYKNAVMEVDEYIGEIMTALKARPDFNAENWMVVITSNKGGKARPENISSNVYDDQTRNVFSLFYSPKFNTKYIQQPLLTDINYSGNAVKYTYANNNFVNATLNDPTLYNMGATGTYTIQFMLKNYYTGSVGYPSVLSKREFGFSGPGWNIFLEGTAWVINTSITGQVYGSTVSDGKWHVLTVVMKREPGKNTIRVYTDGKFNQQGETTWNDAISNNIPIRIGRIPDNGNINPDLLISNLQIYDVAFTDEEVSALSCRPVIDNSHPFYSNLQGYWPGDEGEGTTLTERTGKFGTKANFKLSGPYVWRDFSEVSQNVCPASPDSFFRLVPNSVDIPFQIFQWLGVQSKVTWGLEGKGWAPRYAVIKP